MCKTVRSQAAAALAPASGAGTAVRTVLTGGQALGPIAWVAPEVLAGSVITGVTATPASDVYMLGGLMFEVLTCGLTPYYWLAPMLIAQVMMGVTGRSGHSFYDGYCGDGGDDEEWL